MQKFLLLSILLGILIAIKKIFFPEEQVIPAATIRAPDDDFDDDLDEEEQVGYDHPVFPHVLFYGPPGAGKTSLAETLSFELSQTYGREVRYHYFTPTGLSTQSDIDELVDAIEYGDVVFIDEIHGLDLKIEECLYSALQDFYISRKGFQVHLPKFTMVGATTMAGNLSKPLRDRFPLAIELEPTSEENLKKIILDQQNGVPKPTKFSEYHGQEKVKLLLKMHITALFSSDTYSIREETIDLLAKRSLGNPRILKQFAKHVAADQKVMKRPLEVWEAEELLTGLLGIDSRGLHPADRRVIKALIARENKPIGVAALASVANVSKVDLEQMIEPRLELCGFLNRSPRGRMLTQVCIDEYSK